MAAYKLLRQGESVLLFPGGGREVPSKSHTGSLLGTGFSF